jgi:teichoic acid transport system ATP-binding protein
MDAPDRVHPHALSLIVRDVQIAYRLFADTRRPTLRRLLSQPASTRKARIVHAVRGVSFEVGVGEAVALIGRNGSGKSTLLRAISGLQPVDAGEIYAASPPVLLGVGAALHQELSGRRNIFLGGTALGLSRAELTERMDEIIDFAGVRQSIDLPLRTYSAGMQARLQFAIASALTPDLLLIDEALAVGDQDFRKKSRARIDELLAKASTVFLVSHSMTSVRDICTRAIWLDSGRVVADGPVDDVVGAYEASSSSSRG